MPNEFSNYTTTFTRAEEEMSVMPVAFIFLLFAAAPLLAQANTLPPLASAPANAMTAAPPLPKDRRERVMFLCMAAAKEEAKKSGIQEVTLREVEDTDLKSDDRASIRAKVDLISVTDRGKIKKKRGTMGCATENDTVTRIDIDS